MNKSLFIRNAISRATLTMAQMAYNQNKIIRENSEEVGKTEVALSHADSISIKSGSPSHMMVNRANLSDSPLSVFFYLLGNNSSVSNAVTSWLVKIQLIEIKNLFGNNKNSVYCKVRI